MGVAVLCRIVRDIADSADARSGRIRFRAMRLFERCLNSDQPRMRAAAVAALYRNGGEKTRKLVDARMESEYAPVVLAAYRRIQRETAGD